MIAEVVETDGYGAGLVIDLSVRQQEREVETAAVGRFGVGNCGRVSEYEIEDGATQFDRKRQESWWRI